MRSKTALALAGLVFLAGGSPSAWGQPAPPDTPPAARPAQGVEVADAVRLVAARWRGDILSAEIVPGRPGEKADFVWSVRLLSEAGALIVIRLDAQSGAYLGARGAGLVEARRLPAGG